MKRNLMALPGMLALVLACGEGRTNDQDTGAAGAESGALPADTGMTGAGIEDTTAAPSTDMGAPTGDTTTLPADTVTLPAESGAAGTGGDAAGTGDAANQDQSGVTNTETGESELGGNVDQATPDQGEPVTSKGDTIGTAAPGTGADTGTTTTGESPQ
jgi:hypothetical protein